MPADPPPRDDPPIEEVERALGLHPEDRRPIPGLYGLNVERVPRLRLAGFQVVLLFAAAHNMVLGTGVGWAAFLVVALLVEAYAVFQMWVLQAYFTQVRRVHLGTLFLALDLVAFTVVVWATGAHRSWLWPLYLARVADQMWIGRRRAALMGALGVGCYLALLALVQAGGAEIPWGTEGLKVGVLAALTGYFIVASGLPWDLQERTRAAKELILRLERQSLELERERARAEEASRAKSEFLAQMSHELRTPLNSVVGFARLLAKEDGRDPLSPRQADFARRIHENALHLLEVITDILDIARIQQGGLEMRPRPMDLEEMVREVVSELEPRAQPGVRVFVSFPRTLEKLPADRSRLRQVLVNLLDNALKFTPRGWVRVEVLAEEGGGRPRELRVVDTGVGIAPQELEAAFDPFRQLSTGHARRFEGTGLGLSIARALTELMGFRLEARSAPGEGSTFSVVFRPSDEEGGRPAARDAPPDPGEPGPADLSP